MFFSYLCRRNYYLLTEITKTMKMKKLTLALLLAIAGSTCSWAQWRQVDPRENVGLKDAYKDYFTIGVAVNQRNVSD